MNAIPPKGGWSGEVGSAFEPYKAVIDVVERVNAHWWGLPERAVVPENVLQRIDEHVRRMTPILSTCAA
jgi:hypothetical protein